MNLSPYELSLIAGGFTIIGALIGGWIGRKNALSVYKVSEFNKAAVVFSDAFLPEITFLRHNTNIGQLGNSSDLGEILSSAYVSRHLKAVEVFKTYLSQKQSKAIDQAWQEYCCHTQNPGVPWFEQYSWKMTGVGKQKEKELKELALDRIERILEFAKLK